MLRGASYLEWQRRDDGVVSNQGVGLDEHRLSPMEPDSEPLFVLIFTFGHISFQRANVLYALSFPFSSWPYTLTKLPLASGSDELHLPRHRLRRPMDLDPAQRTFPRPRRPTSLS